MGLNQRMDDSSMSYISPLSIIEPDVIIGENCTVEAFSILRSGVVLGDNVKIFSHCDIGVPTQLSSSNKLVIGSNSIIRSHSVMYIGSNVGKFLTTGHNVIIRENSDIGSHVQIGTLSDIQGDCSIGNYSRLHSNVHVCKKSKIGEFVWLFPGVIFTNDNNPPSDIRIGPIVEDFAIVATKSTLLPGVVIGYGSLVGANSLVSKNVPPEMVAVGVPARIIKQTKEILNIDDGLPAYPWAKHFHRGYPEELFEIYESRRKEIL
jgi:acetyltransferase-like isoleucine patch superfamily enzyme